MSYRKWSNSHDPLPLAVPGGEIHVDPRHSSLLLRAEQAHQRPTTDEPTDEMIARAGELLNSKTHDRNAGDSRATMITNRALKKLAAACGGVITNTNGRPEGGPGYALALKALDLAEALIDAGVPLPQRAKGAARRGRELTTAQRTAELAAAGLPEPLALVVAEGACCARDKQDNLRQFMRHGERLSVFLFRHTTQKLAGKILPIVATWELERITVETEAPREVASVENSRLTLPGDRIVVIARDHYTLGGRGPWRAPGFPDATPTTDKRELRDRIALILATSTEPQ